MSEKYDKYRKKLPIFHSSVVTNTISIYRKTYIYVRGSKIPKSTISPFFAMRYTTYLHYSSFYQKHRLPFYIVTPVVTIIHYNSFENVSEAILQLKLIVSRYNRVHNYGDPFMTS